MDKLTGIGIWSRELRGHGDTDAVEAAAVLLERLGYTAIWLPSVGDEPIFDRVERLLRVTEQVKVATGILNVWEHEPDEVAAAYDRFHHEFPHRFLLGLGVSHAPIVDRDDPGRYRKPLGKMGEFLDGLDDAEPPVPKGGRVLAALGPKMLELARDRAAGAHPYLVAVEHTERAREILGPDPLLAPEQGVVIDRNLGRAHELAKTHLQRYLQLPNYTNNLLRLGFDEDDFENGGSDRLLHHLFALGEPQLARARVKEHFAAGADHVCVQVLAPDPGHLPVAQWRELADVLQPA